MLPKGTSRVAEARSQVLGALWNFPGKDSSMPNARFPQRTEQLGTIAMRPEIRTEVSVRDQNCETQKVPSECRYLVKGEFTTL